MPLTLVLGWRGGGKNVWVVAVTRQTKRLLYSNFKIDHPNYRHLRLINLLALPKHIELVMDEGYTMIDSRTSMSYVNIFCTYLAFQLRKTDTNIYITAQQLGSIDIRYRNEWDYIVYCERVNNGNADWHFWDFLFTVFDKRKGSVSQWGLSYKKAIPLFSLYDTEQIIEPINKSKLAHEIMKHEPKVYLKQGRVISQIIKKNSRVGTKDEIKIALLKNGFDQVWANLCYLIIKNPAAVK